MPEPGLAARGGPSASSAAGARVPWGQATPPRWADTLVSHCPGHLLVTLARPVRPQSLGQEHTLPFQLGPLLGPSDPPRGPAPHHPGLQAGQSLCPQYTVIPWLSPPHPLSATPFSVPISIYDPYRVHMVFLGHRLHKSGVGLEDSGKATGATLAGRC